MLINNNLYTTFESIPKLITDGVRNLPENIASRLTDSEKMVFVIIKSLELTHYSIVSIITNINRKRMNFILRSLVLAGLIYRINKGVLIPCSLREDNPSLFAQVESFTETHLV